MEGAEPHDSPDVRWEEAEAEGIACLCSTSDAHSSFKIVG